MDLVEIGFNGMDWIVAARNVDQLCALVNTVMKPRVP
jgi:hypothetical protein